MFRHVLGSAKRIDDKRAADADLYVGELEKELFETDPDAGQHSSVIPIELYDSAEEDHPYYREMQEYMLEQFRERVAKPDGQFDVLEIGAGTGLLTKRIVQQPFLGMSVYAMKPDSEAQPLLRRKLQSRGNHVHIIQASILTYDPRGKFDFVFSSFSEHHIRPEDKALYFSVVFGTMRPGGYLIIGDEFLALAATEKEDGLGYDAALKRYHQYIMDEAVASHHTQVAELERLAMESGKRDAHPRTDFKVDVKWYKKAATQSGFILVHEKCISPLDKVDTVGGIYVLIFQKPVT